jgi:heme a synthase
LPLFNMTGNEQRRYNPWLHWFAVLSAVITFLLLGLGGLVTSHGAGMSVPDWPNSYGYNMFFFPISHWVGGILYEHSHRLLASFVGLLVVALTRWLGGRPARLPLAIVGVLEALAGFVLLRMDPKWAAAGGFLMGIGGVVLLAACVWARNKPAPGPLPLLGWLAFAGVQLQGLLGGLRVVLIDAKLGIVHAIIGQLFFVLMCAIALLTGRLWLQLADRRQLSGVAVGLRRLVLAATLLIFCQLVIGATMRQAHAGLSIPDFPLAYGKIWPSTTPAAIASYNEHRIQLYAEHQITAFQVILQMVHRLVALGIFILVATSAWQAWRRLGRKDALARLAFFWLGLIVVQIFLGAATIWTNKAADVATAHVLGGALSLVTGALWCVIAFRRSAALPEFAPAPAISGAYGHSAAMAANK